MPSTALFVESATVIVTIHGKKFPLTASLDMQIGGGATPPQLKTVDLHFHAEADSAIPVGKLKDFLADLQTTLGTPAPDLAGDFQAVLNQLIKVPVVGKAAKQISDNLDNTDALITDIEVNLSATEDTPPKYRGRFTLGVLVELAPPLALFSIGLVGAGVKFGFAVEISSGQWLP